MIGAIISAVAQIGGALLTKSSNSKAIKQSTQAQEKSEAAQIAYQREADARNLQYLSPWMTRGNTAAETVMGALGLGGTVPQPAAPPAGALTLQGGYTGPNPGAMVPPGMEYGGGRFNDTAFNDMWQGEWMQPGMAPQGGALQGWGQPQGAPAVPQQVVRSPAEAATDAYELFKKSTGYQTRLQEGQRGQGALYSARGVYQSGARDKALARFNQEFASNEFGNWIGMVGNQQGLGYGASAALGGVATGTADRLGDISARGANFATEAAVARAQNRGALYGSIAGAVGNVAGSLSSYKPMFG